jgi:hypothetical protein
MPVPSATKTLILTQVGDTTDAVCATLIDGIWDTYADYGVVHPRLQRFYTQRECIDLVLGKLREQIDAGLSGDLDIKASQKVANLQAQRHTCVAAIRQIEDQLRSARAPAVGTLDTTEITAPPGVGDVVADLLAAPDAADSRYRGDPYKPLVMRGFTR